MSIPATDTAIDVAYWFFARSEKDNIRLENEKLYHLIFTAQINYARKYNRELLMPSLFVCDENGFTEPNLLKMFSFGRPFMPVVKFSDKVEDFLENMWQKYGRLSLQDFTLLIKGSSAYKELYRQNEKNIVDVVQILDKFKTTETRSESSRKKMLISQNGPVMVSQWNPRKVVVSEKKGI